MLLKVDKERDIHRAYSISSIQNKKKVEIIIKKVEDGFASPAIFDLREGQEVEIEPKEGHLKLGEGENVCFVAAGIGITPFIGLTKKALEDGKKVTLVHGAKYKEELIYRDYFEKLSKENDKFNYMPTVSREEGKNVGVGRVTSHLPKMDLSDHNFYICGQPAMADSTEEIVGKNFEGCKVYKESF